MTHIDDSESEKQGLSKAIEILGYFKAEYDDLQDKYADISMDMTGDEKETTLVKTRNAQVFFASATAGLVNTYYDFISSQIKEVEND